LPNPDRPPRRLFHVKHGAGDARGSGARSGIVVSRFHVKQPALPSSCFT
jgi:hypothetical protein